MVSILLKKDLGKVLLQFCHTNEVFFVRFACILWQLNFISLQFVLVERLFVIFVIQFSIGSCNETF